MNTQPQHIAIIMDGNGRWAKQRGQPRVAGHREGMDTVDTIVTAVVERHIPYLTLYAFSDENWTRPAEEVVELMQLLVEYLGNKQQKMLDQGVRLRTIGNTDRLPDVAQQTLAGTMKATARGDRLTLVLALSYGSRAEICRAMTRAHAAGEHAITPERFSQYLDTAEYPDPDLLIRTSGEYRMSNYLLWQMAYTELYFTEVLWPDFTPEHLDAALVSYEARERRFGGVTA